MDLTENSEKKSLHSRFSLVKLIRLLHSSHNRKSLCFLHVKLRRPVNNYRHYGGTMTHRNVGNYAHTDMVQHPTRPEAFITTTVKTSNLMNNTSFNS